MQRLATIALILLASLLGGCASVRLIDNQVQSFSTIEAIATPATYRFERLPSQEVPEQAVIERMVQTELAKVGLTQVGTTTANATPYTVHVLAKAERDDASNPHLLLYGDPFLGLAGRPRSAFGGAGFYGSLFWVAPVLPPPYYRREVTLLVRDTQTNAVVYETRARHDGPWADSEQIFPAMLQAALQDFPKPPKGERLVGIEIPR